MYSQFESKADLFLVLLEQRIAERAANKCPRVVEEVTADQGIETLLEYIVGVERAEPEWGLVVIDSACTRRAIPSSTAATPRCTKARSRVGRARSRGYERRGDTPPLEPTQLARLMLAISAGHRLEQALDPWAPPCGKCVWAPSMAHRAPPARRHAIRAARSRRRTRRRPGARRHAPASRCSSAQKQSSSRPSEAQPASSWGSRSPQPTPTAATERSRLRPP